MDKSMLTLYHYFRSSTSYRVRIALNLKGLAHELRPINLLNNEQRSPEFLTVNPLGGVPTLEHDGFILPQSLAIIDYLERLQPAPTLYPQDRAFALQIALSIAEDIHPLINLKTQKYLSDHFGVDEAGKKEWYRHWTMSGMAAVETMLRNHGKAGNFALGDQVSIADLCLIPHLYSMRRFGVSLEDYPLSKAIEAHCVRLPAFIAAAPESQSEAPEGLEQIHGRNAVL
ncbi:MAG: maleylacetoacetate isomerase [Alphaproteobacteria bacterium]